MELNNWSSSRMAKYLGVNRVTVYRFETYRRKPSDGVLSKIVNLPNFPLSKDALIADYDAHYNRDRRAS